MKSPGLVQLLGVALLGAASIACQAHGGASDDASAKGLTPHYLEIVTPEVDATCSSLEASHGVRFGPPQADLGGARTAALAAGGLLGVRAPLHPNEGSVVRPYLLVDDIEAALENATAAGAQIGLPATPIEGRGSFAVYFLGGIEHGLWQL